MKAPILREVDGLVARFKKVEDRALDSVARPRFKTPVFADTFRSAPDPDDPEWYQKDYAVCLKWAAVSRDALIAAVIAAFTEEELTAFILAERESPDELLFRAASSARRALKTLAVRRRHAQLLAQNAEGTLPARVCPSCGGLLREDSWDPVTNESGYCDFTQPHACSKRCEAIFSRGEDGGIGRLSVDYGYCCLWCQRSHKPTLASQPGRPPDEGEPGYDADLSAEWERRRAEHDVFRSFCSPICYTIGTGYNAFDEYGEGWEPDDVPRTWSGSPWPRTEYLARPPLSLAERAKAAAGRWPSSVLVVWHETTPEIVGGRPHQWMLDAPAWRAPLEEYAARLKAARALPASVQPSALGEALRALPAAETVEIAEIVTPSALNRYVAYLRQHGPAASKDVAKVTGISCGTLRWLRHQHPERFVKDDGGRSPRWRLAE